MTKNCAEGCFSALLAFKTCSRACWVFAAETEERLFGKWVRYEGHLLFPSATIANSDVCFSSSPAKTKWLPQQWRDNCLSFLQVPMFSELFNSRRTLLWLITRRLIDCLLICLHEKRLDKLFVQLEELNQRLSQLQNVWELVFCFSKGQLVYYVCCFN